MSQEERSRTQQVELIIRVGLRDGKYLWDTLHASPGLGIRTSLKGDLDALKRAVEQRVDQLEEQALKWPPTTQEAIENEEARHARAFALGLVVLGFEQLRKSAR